MEKHWNHRRARMEGETRQAGSRAGCHAEKIDKDTLRRQRILVRQNPDRAICREHFQDGPRRLILFDRLIPAQAAVIHDERVDARIVDGADEEVQRMSEKGLREGSKLPGAHVPRQKEYSLPLCLRGGEILEAIKQNDPVDVLLRVTREAGKFRAHPSKLPYHAA